MLQMASLLYRLAEGKRIVSAAAWSAGVCVLASVVVPKTVFSDQRITSGVSGSRSDLTVWGVGVSSLQAVSESTYSTAHDNMPLLVFSAMNTASSGGTSVTTDASEPPSAPLAASDTPRARKIKKIAVIGGGVAVAVLVVIIIAVAAGGDNSGNQTPPVVDDVEQNGNLPDIDVQLPRFQQYR